jgi:hypothetical protein
MIFTNPKSVSSSLSYDVAIYGAGPAGITLALALAKNGIKVGLFEAGGDSPPEYSEDHPYKGENKGRPYNLYNTRLRYLGGTSNHWGGWCRPLDNYDFEERNFVPVSGWPISRKDLLPSYASALDVCEIPSAGLGLDAFDHDFGYGGFTHTRNDNLTIKNFLFSPPTRFGSRYKGDLDKNESIHCILDASLSKLIESQGAISQAEIIDKSANQFTVTANLHVMAMGATENARTLLYSGIANSSDYVGRCFSDHLGKTIGFAAINDLDKYFLHEANNESISVFPHLAFKDEIYRDNKLVNFGICILPRNPKKELDKEIVNQTSLWNNNSSSHNAVLVRMENIPNPNSRLTLTNNNDSYGIPRLSLDWQPNPIDFDSIDKLGILLAKELGVTGARYNSTFENTQRVRNSFTYQAHHLGTTRMSKDPKDGVVNADLQSHDIDNLYIAGSSVFPTFGFANPTLTIVALSLRLAGHIKSRMENSL